MINYEELEDAALFGIEESLNSGGEGLSENESCWFEDGNGQVIGDIQIKEIA